jgi:hypothetical protein
MTNNTNKMDHILGRALRDREFREKLTTNPRAVAMEEGLAAEELEIIAGGMSISSLSTIAYCTAKTCNEGIYK